METVKLLVTKEEQDIRLDRLLRRTYPYISQGIIERSLRKNFIKLEKVEKKPTASLRLVAGQQISIAKFLVDQTHDNKPAKTVKHIAAATIKSLEKAIIYMDEDIIVLNKPSGLAVQDGTKVTNSVDGMLDYFKFGNQMRPKLVHRIDKDTSGILLIARNTNIAAKLAEGFRDKTIEKHYWALVHNKPEAANGIISFPIAKKNTNSQDFISQEAITHYKTIDYVYNSVAWLEMMPITGRTHQLRIHASRIGSPIVGDSKYAANSYLDGVKHKLHLHARKIVLKNFNGKNLEFTAPLPAHMKQSFEFFGLNCST
jgi:23S rRNA pseudouridine955/2504/2580 synthase